MRPHPSKCDEADVVLPSDSRTALFDAKGQGSPERRGHAEVGLASHAELREKGFCTGESTYYDERSICSFVQRRGIPLTDDRRDRSSVTASPWGVTRGVRVWIGGHNLEAKREIEKH